MILIIWLVLFGAARLGINPVLSARDNARLATGLSFIFIGATHFLMPEKYLEMMPPFVPEPRLMIYISGFFEILGGIGLLVPQTKRWATYGLTALLLAVFPANIYVAVNNVQLGGFMNYPIYQWLRLPLQFALIGWVWFVGHSKR